MALRYLIRVSPEAHAPCYVSPPPGLELTYSQDLVRVYMSRDTDPVLLEDKAGVVIGHLFDRQSYTRQKSLPPSGSDQVRDCDGRHLFERFWGGYVAIVTRGDSVTILRDPSGALPCLCIQGVKGAWTFASDIETLRAANLLKPAVAWDKLAAHLALPDLRTADTCLVGVTEVLAGARWQIGQAQVRRDMLWSPWDYVQPTMDTNGAVRALASTVTSCAKAWAGQFRHVLQGVSGGLDSSILASVLARARPELSLLTMSTDEGQGDETRYARILADALGHELHEYRHSLIGTDISAPTSAHLPRPLQLAFGQSERDVKLQLAEALNIDALFSGIGGDNVFCHIRSATPLVDRYLSEEIGPGLVETLNDICTLTGCTYLEAVTAAIARSNQPRQYKWQPDLSFLSTAAASLMPEPRHPWLGCPPAGLPGKAVHIAMLIRIQATIDGFSRDVPPQINPLLSQPVVELCLGIPTWAWNKGGRDRSLARQAFRDQLPASLLNRRSKGSPNSFAYQVLETNKAKARSLMLDGLLVSQGLIDRDAVDLHLAEARPINGQSHMRLSFLLEAETWARHWA